MLFNSIITSGDYLRILEVSLNKLDPTVKIK